MSIWDTPTDTELLDTRQHADEVVFIGQPQVKAQVEPFVKKEKFPHVLLTGNPGLGKTQFAKWLAWRREKPFYERLAPVRTESLPPYGVLLLDEVHRQRNVEELFPIMDKGVLSFVAATTKPDKLDSAFKSRFLITLRLRKYTTKEIEEIIWAMAGAPNDCEPPILPDQGDLDCINVLANAANGNPRTAERIVRAAQGLDTWEPETVLKAVQITADGLQQDHFEYLAALDSMNRPVGRSQLGEFAWLSDDEIKRVERLLVEKGYVELASNGRRLTVRGEQYVKYLRDEGVL